MPIVTISRGSFAGGKAVAQGVAQRLSCPLLGREEVLAQAAGEFGISEGELAKALNDSPSFWQQTPGKRLAYVKCVTAVLLNHVRSGNLVYHGHVGHLLVAAVPHVLRVRVIADMEMRIKAAMEQLKSNREQAVAHIERVDRDRARWAQLLYGVNWQDPQQYDLVVNLERIGIEAACDLIAVAARSPGLTPTDDGRKALEDLSLSCRVWAALARNPQTRSAGLQVTADNGNVVITGNIGSAKAKEAISQIAQSVDGVRKLSNEVGMGSDWYW